MMIGNVDISGKASMVGPPSASERVSLTNLDFRNTTMQFQSLELVNAALTVL